MKLKMMFSGVALLISTNVLAATYPAPPANQSLIGDVQYKTAASGDNITTVAEKYNLGFNALQKANPQLNVTRGFSSGASLIIPTQHLLPNLPREGIVVNLPEMRMYYYVGNKVLTYPIGIGKIGKTIPIVSASITKKAENPPWVPPEDIRQFNLEQGIILPQVFPAGPDNPLGPYAIYMSIPTFLIHSTIFPESVGKRASFGCLRMYESDIKQFFPIVQKGVPVMIINSPLKVNWQQNKLYMEAYPTLEEHSDAPDANLPGVVRNMSFATKDQSTLVDWQAVSFIEQERDGMPHEVGVKIAG